MRNVIVYKRHGGANQRWKIVYIDEMEKEATKGLNENFGFHVNRPFYLRSRLPMQRVAQCHGASTFRINRWKKNNKTQQFFFDGVSKTIRSNHWKNYAMQIHGNGASHYIRFTSGINSRWW
jgi:hypothetical protein